MIDGEGAVGKFDAAEERFEIWTVEDRYICNLCVRDSSLRCRRLFRLLYVTIESGLYHDLLVQTPCTSAVNRLRRTPLRDSL